MSESARKLRDFAEEIPLCVDLDDTLIRSDSLIENTLQLIAKEPLLIFTLPLIAVARGKAFLKHYVASKQAIDAASLPYNEELISFLRKEQMRGRKLYLVTGANRKVGRAVNNYLRIFDDVYGSDKAVNLVGENKKTFLVKKFGNRQFDYIGDSSHDLSVFKHAHHAILVGVSRSVEAAARKHGNVALVFKRQKLGLKTIVKAMRCHQWVKNLLLFLPLIFAHQIPSPELLLKALLGFLAFSFCASSIYLINDLIDLPADRAHPDKKKRPFASGELPLTHAIYLVPLLWVLSALCVSYLPAHFIYFIGGYALLTTAYTLRLKQVPIADILVLATVFSTRFFAGSIATDVKLSPWFIAFTAFFFLSLALIKRCSELIMLRDLKQTKSKGRGYLVEDIPLLVSLGTSSGYVGVLILALYVNSDNARNLYPGREILWTILPLMLYWLSRMWLITSRGQMHSDPIAFVIKDKVSWFIYGTMGLFWMIASIFTL
jgi:4-hydroxybenzoate polyprenyltransferase